MVIVIQGAQLPNKPSDFSSLNYNSNSLSEIMQACSQLTGLMENNGKELLTHKDDFRKANFQRKTGTN